MCCLKVVDTASPGRVQAQVHSGGSWEVLARLVGLG